MRGPWTPVVRARTGLCERSVRLGVSFADVTFVLLTGATRGIGAAAALALAGQGAELALVGRDAERVHETAEQARAAGGGAPGPRARRRPDARWRKSGASPPRSGGAERIDVLASNAGALFATRQQTVEGLERTFALNHLHHSCSPSCCATGSPAAVSSHVVGGTPIRPARPRRPAVEQRLPADARLRHLETVQHPLHARARETRAGAARHLLPPGRGANRLGQERGR